MAYKTQLELNDEQYDYLLDICSRQGKSLTSVIHDLIDEKKHVPVTKASKPKVQRSPLKRLQEHREIIAQSFCEFHFGE